MYSLNNSVRLTGRLSRDPVLQTVEKEGKSYSVVNIDLAVDNGSDKADFYTLTFWNKNAENLCSLCGKGNSVSIDGHLAQQKRQEGDKTITTTNIVVDSFMAHDFKKSKENAAEQEVGKDNVAGVEM